MQNDTTSAEQDAPCVPEWVRMNHLLSYCAKSVSATVPGGGTQNQQDARRCRRTRCVFSFRKS